MPVGGRDRLDYITLDHIEDLDDTRLEKLYAWVDEIPLSKPKKNIGKDFSDAVLLAELVKYFLPRFVELHNYAPGCGTRHKENNLHLLNRKVLSKLGIDLSPEIVHGLAVCRPMFIENILVILRDKIDMQLARQQRIRQPDWLITDGGQDTSRGQSQLSDVLGANHSSQNTARSTQIPLGQSLPWTGAPQQQVEKLPKSLLEEKEHKLVSCGMQIDGLNAKIQRLEHLCYLKDIRIDELSQQVDAIESQIPQSQVLNMTSRSVGQSITPAMANQLPKMVQTGRQQKGFNTRMARNTANQKGW